MASTTSQIQASQAEVRDYTLNEDTRRKAMDAGLANANWYRSPVTRAQLKELMTRKDGPATRDTIIWLGVMILAGIAGYFTWGTWWAVPCFIVYGTLYGSSADSRWHENGHGTAFKTQWKNNLVYEISCFMLMRDPTVWRWSHARHHTDTIILGSDPEIAVPRPPDILGIVLNFFNIMAGWGYIKLIFAHAAGKLNDAELSFIPEGERWKVYRTARIWLAIYAATILLAIGTRSFLPLMYIGLPTFYGAWFMSLVGLTQHAGLAENVLDHRLNTRTVYMNPVFRFLYLNMNYHVEHHMFPTVPYHALPKLHEYMKNDTPPPYPSTWAAYREIIPALIRQRKDPSYHVVRPLPPNASPILPDGVPSPSHA